MNCCMEDKIINLAYDGLNGKAHNPKIQRLPYNYHCVLVEKKLDEIQYSKLNRGRLIYECSMFGKIYSESP